MNKKTVIWLIAHVGVYLLVTSILRDRGKSEEDAQLGGHVAGSAAGFLLTRLA